GRDEGPAGGPGHLGEQHSDEGAHTGDDEEVVACERVAQSTGHHQRQDQRRDDVDPAVPVGRQSVRAGAGASARPGGAHRTLHSHSPPWWCRSARWRTRRPPVSVTWLVAVGSTTMAQRRTSGGNTAAARSRSEKSVADPPIRNNRLVSEATWAARRADSMIPCLPRSERHTASRAWWPSPPDEAWGPHTKETSNSSSTARTAMEAATDMAVSKSSGSDQDPA